MSDIPPPSAPNRAPTAPIHEDQWREYIAHLRTNYTQSAVLLDKLIITLAGGAIGLSLTVVDHAFASAVPQAFRGKLATAWVFLGLAMFITLISHYVSIGAHHKALDHAQKMQAGKSVLAEAPVTTDRITGVLTLAAIIALAIGLICMYQMFSYYLYHVQSRQY